MQIAEAVRTVEEEYISIKEAAELLGVNKQSIYTAIRENRLPSVRILGNLVVRRADVLTYQQRTEGIGPKGGRPRTRPVPVEGAVKQPLSRSRKASGE